MTLAASLALLSGAVGAVYCAAAIAKLASGPQQLAGFLDSLGFPPRAHRAVARLVPYAELAIGLAVVIRPGVWTGAVALALAIGFLVTLLVAARRKVRESCHCFGAIDPPAAHTPVPVIRAGVLAAACAAVLAIALARGQVAASGGLSALSTGIIAGLAFTGISALGSQVWGLLIINAEIQAAGFRSSGGRE